MVIFIISLLLTSQLWGGEGVDCVIFEDVKVLKKSLIYESYNTNTGQV